MDSTIGQLALGTKAAPTQVSGLKLGSWAIGIISGIQAGKYKDEQDAADAAEAAALAADSEASAATLAAARAWAIETFSSMSVYAEGGRIGKAQGGRIRYEHGGTDWFPFPSYKSHNELEEERYRDMSDKELEAILEKEKQWETKKFSHEENVDEEGNWLDYGLAERIIDERKAKEIGGDYRSWFGGYRKNEAGLEMIDTLQEYKYGDKSKDDLIRDLENKWDEEIEEGYEPGQGGYFDDLYIFNKEDIEDKVNRGWDIAEGPITDTGIMKAADGGRINRNMGGIASMQRQDVTPQGMELDLRVGGFIPIGAQEKADDVKARVSKNEFVFTADAVKAAGGGSVNEGAKRMYDTMKRLESQVA
jgi:hypothetical protein